MGADLGNLLDVGSLAHAVADAVLPKEMQWMSGVLGAAIDIQCGNPLGALKEGLDVIKDVKEESLSSPQKPPPSFTPIGGWQHEPSPPPVATSTVSLRATPPARAGTTVTVSTTTTATVTTADPQSQGLVARAQAGATTFFQTAAPPPPPPPPSTMPAPTAWRGTLQTAAPPPPPPPPSTMPAPTAWRGTPAASSPTYLSLAQLASQQPFGPQRATQDPKTMTKDQFFAQDDEALMKAVRDGNVPKAVSDDESAMKTLQARMNHFSEMNQLMTSMIQALHQMQMAIIQNVRV
jgi:hypothetical protein